MSEQEDVHHEERALLALAAQGGRAANAAMRTLFTRYQRRFKAHLRERGFGAADIDDTTQRVWADVWRKVGEFTAEGVPSHWLWGFFRNAKNDLLRKTAQRGERFISGDADAHTGAHTDAKTDANIDFARDCQTTAENSPAAPPTHPSPQAHREARDFRDCVQQAFAAFKRQQPDAAHWVYLRHVEEWDLAQIAEYRGCTPHAAAQMLSKARTAFGRLIAPCRDLQVA